MADPTTAQVVAGLAGAFVSSAVVTWFASSRGAKKGASQGAAASNSDVAKEVMPNGGENLHGKVDQILGKVDQTLAIALATSSKLGRAEGRLEGVEQSQRLTVAAVEELKVTSKQQTAELSSLKDTCGDLGTRMENVERVVKLRSGTDGREV